MFVSSRFIDRAAEISSAAGVDGRVPGLFIYIKLRLWAISISSVVDWERNKEPPLYYFKGRFSAKKGKHTHKWVGEYFHRRRASSASSAAVTESTQRSFDWTMSGGHRPFFSCLIHTIENNDEFRSKMLWRKCELYRKSSFISRWVGNKWISVYMWDISDNKSSRPVDERRAIVEASSLRRRCWFLKQFLL